MALKKTTWIGVALLSICLVFSSVSGAPASSSLPTPCVNGLMNLVSCLNSSTTNGEVGIKTNIVQRCSSLTAMAKCQNSIPHECRAMDDFKELDALFGLSDKISSACSSPIGRKNMLDLTECNDRIPQAFETCFNFTVIDHALQFHSGVSQNFADMCCAIQNGQKCYSTTVVSQCGDKGKKALDATVGFLLRAMSCNGSISCP